MVINDTRSSENGKRSTRREESPILGAEIREEGVKSRKQDMAGRLNALERDQGSLTAEQVVCRTGK